MFSFNDNVIELNGIPVIDKIEKWMGNKPTIKKIQDIFRIFMKVAIKH